MPRAFIAYNFGTHMNQERIEEVVANPVARATVSENCDWIINYVSDSRPSPDNSLSQTPGVRDLITGKLVRTPVITQLWE